jgi:hypothetical protein
MSKLIDVAGAAFRETIPLSTPIAIKMMKKVAEKEEEEKYKSRKERKKRMS